MVLIDLLREIEYTCVKGDLNITIRDICYDSRKAEKGDVFVCISGETMDARQFIPQVVEKGIHAVIVEKEILIEIPENITVVRVVSARKALAAMACAYFGYPSKELVTIGLTGTKGKTTTSYMIQKILETAGKKVGVIGTIGAIIDKKKRKTSNTTPESYELQKLFREMADAECQYCVMEVSSQGLKMNRVSGFTFDYGIFTNFSPDHIGPKEHDSLEEYLYCKSLLFQQCKIGLLNIDDVKYKAILNNHTCEVQTFGFDKMADLSASNVEYVKEPGVLGVAFEVNGILNSKVLCNIPGKFSVYNSLTALLLCRNLGIEEEAMKQALARIRVPGRVEIIDVPGDFTILIDYAHNAMSVESILTTIREYNPKRMVCVYGGGGNRSRLRRYDMGELCGELADLSILTCDNPRDEEIKDINQDIITGLKKSGGKYIEIEDRKEAILYSMEHAKSGDVIILLGKGHEDYQEIKGKKYHFSEREIIEEYAQAKRTLIGQS